MAGKITAVRLPGAGRGGTFLNQGPFAFGMDLVGPLGNGTPCIICSCRLQLCLFSLSQHVDRGGVLGSHKLSD